MKVLRIDLTELVKDKNIDLIAGRDTGEKYAQIKKVLDHLKKDYKIVLSVDDSRVKTINDSFWKGFFSEIFSEFKSKERVKSFFELNISSYKLKVLEKNLDILNSIYNI